MVSYENAFRDEAANNMKRASLEHLDADYRNGDNYTITIAYDFIKLTHMTLNNNSSL